MFLTHLPKSYLKNQRRTRSDKKTFILGQNSLFLVQKSGLWYNVWFLEMAECFGGPTSVENKARLAATHWCRQVERVKVSSFGPWGSKMEKKNRPYEMF